MSTWREVLSHYPADCRPREVHFLANAGGFSGARFWRIASARGELCLRQWPPEHPSPDRLAYMHRVLRLVQRRGFPLAATPLPTSDGRTFVNCAGRLWELSPWMKGTADFHRSPSNQRLAAAMKAAAEFHGLAAAYGVGFECSPGVADRTKRLSWLADGGMQELASAIRPRDWPEMADRAGELFRLFPLVAPRVEAILQQAAESEVPIQPCIRDIWRDHVLFTGDEVTGLIDFGAMRPDNVACDVARLLGSLAGDDPRRWEIGLAAYQQRRPLTPEELRLVKAFDASFVLLSGFNWLEWVFRDARQFEQRDIVLRRVDAILQRLSAAAGRPC